MRLRRGQFVEAGPHRHELHPGPKSDPLLAGSDLAIIGWLYLLTNAARVVTYIPQIVAFWRCTNGALSVSLLTWGSWVLSNLTATVYGALVVRGRADGLLSWNAPPITPRDDSCHSHPSAARPS